LLWLLAIMNNGIADHHHPDQSQGMLAARPCLLHRLLLAMFPLDLAAWDRLMLPSHIAMPAFFVLSAHPRTP
jgi:hypothetical protein